MLLEGGAERVAVVELGRPYRLACRAERMRQLSGETFVLTADDVAALPPGRPAVVEVAMARMLRASVDVSVAGMYDVAGPRPDGLDRSARLTFDADGAVAHPAVSKTKYS